VAVIRAAEETEEEETEVAEEEETEVAEEEETAVTEATEFTTEKRRNGDQQID
jgi:hypothetical protein